MFFPVSEMVNGDNNLLKQTTIELKYKKIEKKSMVVKEKFWFVNHVVVMQKQTYVQSSWINKKY